VKAEEQLEEPDESLLAESFIQQFKPFEKTVYFSKGLKEFDGSPNPVPIPSLGPS